MKGEHGQLYFLQTDVKVEPNLNATKVPTSDHVWTKGSNKGKSESEKKSGKEHGVPIHSNDFELLDFMFLVFTRK